MIYEILYIVPSKFSDNEVDGAVERVASIFSKHGAEVKETKTLGKIKLAYPIKQVTHGTYILVFIESETEKVQAIDFDLKLAPEVLRHTMLKREKGIPSFSFNMVSYAAPLTPEGKRSSVVGLKNDKVQKAPSKKEADKISAQDLDKKLDEILESDIVADV
ncbi:30S ribosomal protein S6 [Patescibacteria group bacterium]|nr:30S ribosomal protein S6 [Patescibacteria group bacterium]